LIDAFVRSATAEAAHRSLGRSYSYRLAPTITPASAKAVEIFLPRTWLSDLSGAAVGRDLIETITNALDRLAKA
jgi:hypothetical protein